VFDRARRRLVDELGLDPGPELQAVAQEVRHRLAGLLPCGRVGPTSASNTSA
jgi:hypothetical protein